MSDQKQIYRIEAMRHRERIDIRQEDPDIAADNFISAIKPQAGQIIAGYWPKGREFDTAPLLDKLIKMGCRVCLPVITPNSRILDFVFWNEDAPLVQGKFDVLHPPLENAQYVTPDIVIVPLLAFDRRGNRLGYGGGYYDATLENLRDNGNVIAAGFAYSQQAVLFNLPSEPHDQKLDWVITPQKNYNFTDQD